MADTEPASPSLEAGPPPPPRSDRSWWNWLIAVPLVLSLTVPIFNRDQPSIGGVPFFYWYQVLAIAVGVVATILVFRAHDRANQRRG